MEAGRESFEVEAGRDIFVLDSPLFFKGGRPTFRFGSSSVLLLGRFLGPCEFFTWFAVFLTTAGLGCGTVLDTGVLTLTGGGGGVGGVTLFDITDTLFLEETWLVFLEAVVGIGANTALVLPVVVTEELIIGVFTKLATAVLGTGDTAVLITKGELSTTPGLSFSWLIFACISLTVLLVALALEFAGRVLTVDGFRPLGLGVPGRTAAAVGETDTALGMGLEDNVPVLDDDFGVESGFGVWEPKG